MPRNPTSREEKAAVRERIEELIGPTTQGAKRRTDWRIAHDESVSAFVTFSKSSQLFYDVNRDDLDEWLAYPRAFVIFVMGRADDVLIVPVAELDEELHRARHRPAEGGNYKLHIESVGGQLRFREAPYLNLMQYRNNYEQLTNP